MALTVNSQTGLVNFHKITKGLQLGTAAIFAAPTTNIVTKCPRHILTLILITACSLHFWSSITAHKTQTLQYSPTQI